MEDKIYLATYIFDVANYGIRIISAHKSYEGANDAIENHMKGMNEEYKNIHGEEPIDFFSMQLFLENKDWEVQELVVYS